MKIETIFNSKKMKKLKLKKKTVKTKKEQVLVVAQEIKFARHLSSNDKKTRDRALKSLNKWLTNCMENGYMFKESDFMRIWKGLFYAVWMADKPLVQEELCEAISALPQLFPAARLRDSLLLTKSGLKALASEWYGLDQHRLDKFLMLARRCVRGSLRAVRAAGWEERACRMYARMLSHADGLLAVQTPPYAANATSLILHITDCFLEELSKVSQGSIPGRALALLLRPWLLQAAAGGAAGPASRRLLTTLVRQSEVGIQYQEQTEAWKQMGCPKGGPEALEQVSDDDEDDDDHEEKNGDAGDSDDEQEPALDPRAGRVDVVLRPLPVPCAQLAGALRAMLPRTAPHKQRRLRVLLARFEMLAENQYPLPVEEVPSEDDEAAPAQAAEQAAHSLQALEKTLAAAADELALRGLSRKHRKRLLAKSRAGLSIVEDAPAPPAPAPAPAPGPAVHTDETGDWQVEDTKATTDRQTDSANKENLTQPHKKVKKRKQDKKEQPPAKKQKTQDKKPDKTSADRNNRQQARQQDTPQQTNQQPATTQPASPPKQTGDGDKKKAKLNNETTIGNTPQETKKNGKKLKRTKLTKNLKSAAAATDTEDILSPPKKVKFALKNNCTQGPVDYYRSVERSPGVPFDGARRPAKTNLKPGAPSPVNPFFKRKLKLKLHVN